MIKVNGGSVEVKGTRIELMTECTCLIHSLLEKDVIDKSKLIDMMALASMSCEDLKTKILNEIDDMENIGDALILLSSLGI